MAFEDLTDEQQLALLEELQAAKEDDWKKTFSNYSGNVGIGLKRRGRQKDASQGEPLCLVFQVRTKKSNLKQPIPPHINYKGYQIPTDVVIEKAVKPFGYRYGDRICRQGYSSTYGSAGALVSMDFGSEGGVQVFLMSCFHVLFSNYFKLENRNKPDFRVKYYGNNEAKIINLDQQGLQLSQKGFGELSQQVDIAFAKVLQNDYSQYQNIIFSRERRLNAEDLRSEKLLYTYGAKSKELRYGKVCVLNNSRNIGYYFEGSRKQILIRHLIYTTPISSPGDSGTAVYTAEGDLVGIIIAGGASYSYVLPLHMIKSRFNLNINVI